LGALAPVRVKGKNVFCSKDKRLSHFLSGMKELHHHRAVILSEAQRSRKPALSEAEGDLQLLFLCSLAI
jgi:hypothetical protein